MADQIHHQLHNTDDTTIKELALTKLDILLERCTKHLIAELTGITRPTLDRWLDESKPLEVINKYHAVWFILFCETSPKIQMLMDRPPFSHPRLAKRVINGEHDNG